MTTPEHAAESLARRRQLRILAMLLVALWSIIAVALDQLPQFSGGWGLVTWLGGSALIVVAAERVHRSISREAAIAVIVDHETGERLDADRAAKQWAERNAAPGLIGFAIYIGVGHIGEVLFDRDLPLWFALMALGAGVASFFQARASLTDQPHHRP